MPRRVHLRTAEGIACGADRSHRWGSTVLSSVATPQRVTCRTCLRLGGGA